MATVLRTVSGLIWIKKKLWRCRHSTMAKRFSLILVSFAGRSPLEISRDSQQKRGPGNHCPNNGNRDVG
jgi:hypothetical protein